MSLPKQISLLNRTFPTDHFSNIPQSLLSRLQQQQPLNTLKHHPIAHLQKLIHQHFPKHKLFSELSPIVKPKENFDQLLIPLDHPSRSIHDSYYFNQDWMLRTHTSAHQSELIRAGNRHFLVCGDVYRRDEVDRTHAPVFYQLEGVSLFNEEELSGIKEEIVKPADLQPEHEQMPQHINYLIKDLQLKLTSLIEHLFHSNQLPVPKHRWISAYFPFTQPSFELEIFNEQEEKWLEVLGCGIIQSKITNGQLGWAFGLGLERLAMLLYQIPDIRIFHSQDERILKQWMQLSSGRQFKYEQVSKYPPIDKDLSFYLLPHSEDSKLEFSQSAFYDLLRNLESAGCIEQVSLIDEYMNPKTKLQSKCFRLRYRSMERTLTHAEVDLIQTQISSLLEKTFSIKLR